jgi:hypothetical protein
MLMKFLTLFFLVAFAGFVRAGDFLDLTRNVMYAVIPSDSLKIEPVHEIQFNPEGVLTMTLREDIKARYLIFHTDGKLIADLGYRHLTAGKQTIHTGLQLSTGNYLLGTQARGGELQTYKFSVKPPE